MIPIIGETQPKKAPLAGLEDTKNSASASLRVQLFQQALRVPWIYTATQRSSAQSRSHALSSRFMGRKAYRVIPTCFIIQAYSKAVSRRRS